ncbi:MAG: hybrid sensor histidine kinase/response regulator [Sphingomonadales bacterium CG12_big_fil_rev_8_21_14_0_65_65_10]|nr:MAG: hybrid sensor histidine kinase/response regulator [Sphingomonadales bacterium CG12_big_fil_rev_8_21_14_0_65_65_10]
MSDLADNKTDTGARILIVDDDERNLLALSETLRPLAEVTCVASGKDALRELLQHEFAVILLDVYMPEMDGYETAALIRERSQTAQVPIIFLSAVNKETSHLMRGYEMGAVDYVFKPVDPIILKTKVGVFVDLYETRQQVAEQAQLESSLREAHLREQLDRIAVERKLQESERRQASVLGTLPMAVYECPCDATKLTRTFVGGDLHYFVGDTASEIFDGVRRFDEWVHPDDLTAYEAGGEENGDAVTSEYRFVGPDGRKRHLLDQRIKVAGPGGQPQWVGTILDLTDRRELEEKLVHAGKLDALGQLTGGVAHDFNNLLAAVLGGINILDRRLEVGEAEKRVIEQMRHAAHQGTDLVKRMMAFARRQDLTPTSVKPTDLCDAVAGLVEHALGDNVSASWNCGETDLSIYADRSQLELALMNLVINARDAMPDGGTVEVSIEEVGEADAPALAIRVCDSGIGMSKKVLKKVTEPFFTTKGAGKGTGLGLSMVAGFVDQSGGELEIQSTLGKGTEIAIKLPATESVSGEDAAEQARELSWFEDRRLALVDDDDGVRIVLSEQLRDAGAKVEEYASGAELIAAIGERKRDYDVVISDFAMPGLDGLETLQRIRNAAPHIGRVLMTGNIADENLANLEDLPLVHKPVDLKSLASACVRALQAEPV